MAIFIDLQSTNSISIMKKIITLILLIFLMPNLSAQKTLKLDSIFTITKTLYANTNYYEDGRLWRVDSVRYSVPDGMVWEVKWSSNNYTKFYADDENIGGVILNDVTLLRFDNTFRSNEIKAPDTYNHKIPFSEFLPNYLGPEDELVFHVATTASSGSETRTRNVILFVKQYIME